MSDFIQKLFTTRQNYSNGDTRIGEQDRIWYDSITNTFRISDGSTPGGVIITGGGGSGTGPKGDTGTAATITVGTVSVSTTTATVTNVGTLQAALFNFVLQQGPQGLKGDTGTTGATGLKGDTGTFTGTLALTDLSDVNIVGIPSDGHVLKYDAVQGHWAPAADLTGGGGGGLALSDLDAVVDNTPSGNGSLAYNDTTGVFTYTPPYLSAYLTSVDSNSLTGTTLTSTVVTSSLTSLGTLTDLTVTNTIDGSISGSVIWINPSPAPADPWRTSISANSGNANIVLWTGLPGVGTSVSWTFDSTKLTFPDTTEQTTAWLGAAAAGTLTGTALTSTVVTSSLTSVGTLTGLTVGGTGGDLVMTGGAITGVGNITATGTVAVNAAGGITTTALAFDIVNGTATTVNIGGAATAINIGSTAAGTLTVNNPTIVGSSSTQALFNTVATTINAFGVASALTIGATGGTLTLRNPTIVGSQTTQNLFNTVATTLNFAGATTTLNVGAATGITTINNRLNVTGGASVTGTLTATNFVGTLTTAAQPNITSVGTLVGVTSNAATAFIAGDAAISGIALQIPREGALRNLYNGANNMYFDVSIGGTTQGAFQFRSSSAFTNVLTMSSTAITFNTGASVIAQTPALARTAFNSAIDTEITVDEMRFRISNQGGIFPQVIGNGSSRNLAWTSVGAISGTAINQVGSVGTIVASNAWTTLYNLHGMDNAGDTVTVTLQDKAGSRIYRITFMRSDNGSTTGYNIIGERLM